VSTFVSVGNAKQPFHRLLSLVHRSAAALPQPVFVQHGHTPFEPDALCSGSAFLGMDEFAQRMASADLVILHAGAGSLIHAIRAGKVPVLMARSARHGEHVDDHQAEFVREIVAAGRALAVDDNSDLATVAGHALAMQSRLAGQSATPPLVSLVAECLAASYRPGCNAPGTRS